MNNSFNPFEQHGAFSWCELMTSDPSAAQAFYGQLFGWEMKDGPVQGIEYKVVSAGGMQMGGITELPKNMPGMPPTWGTYVTVDDVEITTQKVVELGGKVLMQPHDIPEVGRFALIQDPQGAVLSIISYQLQPIASPA